MHAGRGGQKSTPDAQNDGSFPLVIFVHFNVLSGSVPPPTTRDRNTADTANI